MHFYIHIPFCESKCNYCAFTSLKKNDYEKAKNDYRQAKKEVRKYLNHRFDKDFNRERYLKAKADVAAKYAKLEAIINQIKHRF